MDVAIRSRALICLLAAGAVAIEGCASRSAEPPQPVEPRKPIGLLAVLPVSMPLSESNTGFGAARVPLVVPIVVATPGPAQGGLSPGQAAATTVFAAAIAVGIQSYRRARQEALDEALAQIAFDPAAYIESRLVTALEQQQMPLVRITDPQIAEDLRAGRFEGLPAGVDAILDVRIPESGYYSSFRAGGYSPMLLIRASLLRPVAEAEPLDEFQYYADWRDAGRDRRWITTPKSMLFPDAGALKANAPRARADLMSVADRMVALMVEDVKRAAAGQARVD
jgi:hypothetical protein